MTAALLSIFLGGLGIGRFYMGYTTIGIIQLCLSCTGISGIWGIIDGIQILTDKLTVDGQGNPFGP